MGLSKPQAEFLRINDQFARAPSLERSSPTRLCGRLAAPVSPGTPLRSWLIHGGVLVLWALLFAMAFKVGNVRAWSVGVAYVLYDTVLLLFVAWMTLPILRQRPSPSSGPASASAAAAMRRNTLGVIVAAHNEAAVLPVTLAALLGQSDSARPRS
jgi:hypothetical protein